VAQTAPAPRSKRAGSRVAKAAVTDGPAPTLRILETRILRGPNYWAREPVIRMLVDLGSLEDYPSNTIPGFVERLMTLMPSLEEHACSLGRRGGFVTRLHDGTWAGHVAEHIALELQNLAGTDVRHGKTRSAGPRGQYKRSVQSRLACCPIKRAVSGYRDDTAFYGWRLRPGVHFLITTHFDCVLA
jgi:hypothetical protein